MSAFYVLLIGRFAQYKYAWFETTDRAQYSDAAPTCPVCGRAVGMLRWLPPHDVLLKQPRRVGDLVSGAGGCDFLVSEKFVNEWQTEGLVGFERCFEVNVLRMGTTTKARSLTPPRLWGVDVVHSPTAVLHDRMRIVWERMPEAGYCRTCGPGGGGSGGIIKSWGRVVVDVNSWSGEDLFYAINFPGTLLLSDRGADFIGRHGFTNVRVVPAEEYAYAFGHLGVIRGGAL